MISMANTYSQLYFHVVFAVKGRANLISAHNKEELNKYITGIISNKNQKLMIINGMPDHMHLLISLKPDCCLSDLVREIKTSSSHFVNEKKWVAFKFEWQKGFGAFTVSHSGVKAVANYIENQEAHHRDKKFRDEYMGILKNHEVAYKDEYLFDEC